MEIYMYTMYLHSLKFAKQQVFQKKGNKVRSTLNPDDMPSFHRLPPRVLDFYIKDNQSMTVMNCIVLN